VIALPPSHSAPLLLHGDCLALLRELPDASVDALITDGPYSSGGMVRGDRTAKTTDKYTRSDSSNKALPEFTGDNRDQRGFAYWSAMWLSECLRVTKPGAPAMLFTDWRQLPVTTDAFQAGGFVWRGLVPWYKPNSRPQRGRFGSACEYIVWGSNGPMPIEGDCFPGFFEFGPPRDREHTTQKPLELMLELVKICPPGGIVLDPFAGSGTTGVAAALSGRRFIGFELSPRLAEVARTNVCEAAGQFTLDPAQAGLFDALATG
jgi:site-specific DNA-methyltransferase (adenine-specific)